MMPDENKIPPGPLGTIGEIRQPYDLKLGDMIHFDGVFFPITDMAQARGGARVLHFRSREPYLVTGPTLVYRPVELNGLKGTIRFVSTVHPA
ncbi:hypothetical protein AB0G73_10460 [Streptomyces sp. NPDC020719]|uniref:hypothetical protein n=1 Tax=Streptomyces sp. NPDC020719 TaxID=3154896 RepID=UPI0033EC62A5